ncbi:MAG: HAD family phosphatase, partial [Lachnospiraceae bacterium]|nr:HAD family phosphatase [Lachnospiraceae bacterium]
MGKVLLQYNPHAVCRQYCQSPEEEAVVFRELFEGPEWVLMDKGEMTPEESLLQIKQRVPEKFHKALSDCLQNWTECMIPVPGAKDFVKEVRNAGYDLYVLSNAAPVFYDYFPKEYPLEIFDDVVVSCDVHKVKPDPAIYLHLLRTNELRSQECLFIDDSPENVETAKDLGMKAMVFDGDWKKIREELGEGALEDETIGESLRRRLSGRRIRITLAVLIVILLASTLPLAV